ncbi:MAG: VCBS repeat-containing protein [Gammaproteobacteria bacterium]|nr:VCBS repeat-containing protein [Gammaproteobacteria bacterium]
MNIKTSIVGTFLALSTAPAMATTFSVAVNDFNTDGVLDTAVMAMDYPNQSTTGVYFGDGTGNMTPGSSWFLGDENNLDIAAGDLNGDGIGDLAVASGNGIFVYHGDVSGGFTTGATLNANAKQVYVGDFNRDGLLDIIQYYASIDVPASVSVFFGYGDGGFSDSVKVIEAVDGGQMMALDVNGDGMLDVMFYSQGSVTAAFGDGAGGFTVQPAGVLGRVAEGGATSMTGGDFNGDGIADIAVNSDGARIIFFAGSGTGGFTQYASVFGSSQPDSVSDPIVAGDVNADGMQDLIVVDSATGAVSAVLGYGDGVFLESAATTGWDSCQNMVDQDYAIFCGF